MSEPKPKYEYSEGVLEGALLEQLQALHYVYSTGIRKGEFTIQQYATSFEIYHKKASEELDKAIEDGKVTMRKAGAKSYYRMAE